MLPFQRPNGTISTYGGKNGVPHEPYSQETSRCPHISGRGGPEGFIELPEIPDLIAPLIYSIPLQLLAYHVAILKGTDIDQPRNLAKSVTVE
jgi:hypothetical protein